MEHMDIPREQESLRVVYHSSIQIRYRQVVNQFALQPQSFHCFHGILVSQLLRLPCAGQDKVMPEQPGSLGHSVFDRRILVDLVQIDD